MIYIPLTELPEARKGELVFNSRSAQEMEVTPTFYKRDGTTILGEPVRVKSAEIRYVDFKTLIPLSHRSDRDWGGMSLSYYGHNREMWAQFRLLGVSGRGSVDEFFTVKDESRSSVYQAAWWMPRDSTAIIALGNITDVATSATVSFGSGYTQTVNLAPHATEIVRQERGAREGTESVVITVTGAAGSVVPTGLIASKNGLFNSVIRLYDTQTAKQSHLFATGFRLANLTSHMVLKNTSSVPIAAQPKFSGSSTAVAEPVLLPEITLGPNETTEVDLKPLLAAAEERADLDVVSVDVNNSGGPGSLIGSLYGIDNKTRATYETPLRDSGSPRTMTGSYPWQVAKDFTTTVYITNISDQEAEFVSQINYEGGKFVIEPRKLKPGETARFDLRKIRDEQMRDNAGLVLPRTIAIGQFRWAVRGVTNGKVALIGRAEMVSRSQHISSSYSCNDPCPPFYVLTVDGFDTFVGQAKSYTMTAWETALYDSGSTIGPYAAYPSWSDDNSLCSYSSSDSGHTCLYTGVNVGSGFMTAFSRMEQSYGWDGRDCYDNNYTYAVEETDTMTVLPTITVGAVSISPNVINTTTDATLSITLAVSSGAQNTTGTTLEVGIANASGPFTLNITPTSQSVQLQGGQSQTYTFNVHLASAPSANRTCNLTAHVSTTGALMVVGNDAQSPQLTIQNN